MFPALAAVGGAENSTLLVRRPDLALDRDKGDVRVIGMNLYPGNLAAFLKPDMLPGFSAVKGFINTISVENTGGFLGGDKDFVKGFYVGSFYYSPINKIVIEFKGRAGLADSYADTDKVPIYERFFAGGANTIRGFEERDIGPRDISGEAIGGEAMAQAVGCRSNSATSERR